MSTLNCQCSFLVSELKAAYVAVILTVRRVRRDQGARVGLATRLSTPPVSTPAEVESCSNGYCCLTSCMLQNSVFRVCKVRLLSILWPGVCVCVCNT